MSSKVDKLRVNQQQNEQHQNSGRRRWGEEVGCLSCGQQHMKKYIFMHGNIHFFFACSHNDRSVQCQSE